MKKFDPSLYFITDSTNCTEEEFLCRVEQALKGGVTLLQLREKNRSTREYIELAEKVHAIAKRYNVPLIIDDRVDVALAMDAEGVHVGAEDMPVATARRLMGDDKIVGATAKTVPWAKEAYEQGADYVRRCNLSHHNQGEDSSDKSTDTLRDICNAVPIPANAIGGLNKGNIDVLTGIPIAGICVVSAIMKADDPKMATEELKARAHELALIK